MKLEGTKAANSAVYLEPLEKKNDPCMQKDDGAGMGPNMLVFQQGNARPHTTKSTKAWLDRQPFQLMKWPARSHDLSWIESIWSWMADSLSRRLDLNEANFTKAVMETWDSIPKSVMDAQFSSIRGKHKGRGRLPECIAVGGDSTRF